MQKFIKKYRIYGNVQKFTDIYINLHKFTEVARNLQKLVEIYGSLTMFTLFYLFR